MLRKRITIAGLAFFALAASEAPVLADGAPAAPAPAPVSKSHWSGFYLGVGGGIGKVDQSVSGVASKLTTIDKYKKVIDYEKKCFHWPYYYCIYVPVGSHYEPDGSSSHTATENGSFSDESWKGFGTIQFGADHLAHDRLLVGVFADVDLYRGADATFGTEDCDLSVSGKLGLERVWNVGGRIGLLAHPNFLIYGVGGYSQADIDSYSEVDFKHGGPDFTLRPDDKLRGYFLGGGAEWLFHENIALKVEYRWARYDGEGDSDSAVKGPYVDYDYHSKEEITKYYSTNADFDLDVQSIRGALVVRFGRDEPAPAPLKQKWA